MFETTFGCSVAELARARHDDEDRLAGLDERDRAVLELAGGEALGVDVGELLELERTLEGDRVADVAAEEQHRAGVGHPVRELLDALAARARATCAIFAGIACSSATCAASLGLGERAAHAREVQAEAGRAR